MCSYEDSLILRSVAKRLVCIGEIDAEISSRDICCWWVVHSDYIAVDQVKAARTTGLGVGKWCGSREYNLPASGDLLLQDFGDKLFMIGIIWVASNELATFGEKERPEDWFFEIRHDEGVLGDVFCNALDKCGASAVEFLEDDRSQCRECKPYEDAYADERGSEWRGSRGIPINNPVYGYAGKKAESWNDDRRVSTYAPRVIWTDVWGVDIEQGEGGPDDGENGPMRGSLL